MKLLKLGFLLIGLVLFVLILRETDLETVWQEMAKIGFWGLVLVLLVYAVAFLVDNLIWLLVFPDLPVNLHWIKRFYLVRLAGQAFNYITPLASLGGEPLKAMMLKNHYGLSYRDSGISLVISKTVDVLGLVIFLATGFVLVYYSQALSDSYKTLATAGLIAMTLSGVGTFLVQRLKLTSASARQLSKTSIGRKLKNILEFIHQFDDQLVTFYTQHRSSFFITLVLAVINWSFGVVEIYLVMLILGYPISIGDALIIESMAQLVRAATFFIPASIGAQEGAFFLICNALTGMPELGVAIAMVRRFREITFIAIGLFIWWVYSLRN